MGVPRLAELFGQPGVSAFLRRIVASGRYGNAYLFHGPAGVGKGTAALAFARAALCARVPGGAPEATAQDAGPSLFAEVPVTTAASGTGDDACGECASCRKAATLQHPDLRFLFPISGPGGEREFEENVVDMLGKWREDPLFVFAYEKAASLRVAQIHDLQKELAYRPYEAARRVVVIRDCDRMREDQYSALLKSVEEPGALTAWVLTTSRLSRVPATIRSRCQRVRFAPLAEAAVGAFLVERAGVAAADARLLAALANGSLARALTLRTTDYRGERDAALALLKPALDGDPVAMWKGVQAAMKFGHVGREGLRRILEIHQLWLRDLLRARYAPATASLVHFDREREIRMLAERIDATEIRRRLFVLEEALRSIEGNVSPDLTLFSTLGRVGGARMGDGAWPAHATGRWNA